ncbi:hypothetical protein [Teredinibacter turnerae]|uniref:hypothetical protein n=1 Tax=Teredinibacter turnerae TaxID=2426 RepID=UPI0018AD35AE|nr:hypothetical protein [Teredinibacter turnerae]
MLFALSTNISVASQRQYFVVYSAAFIVKSNFAQSGPRVSAGNFCPQNRKAALNTGLDEHECERNFLQRVYDLIAG